MSLQSDQGELVMQPGGKRFAANFNTNRTMCKVCGATVFRQTSFGHLEDGVFVVDYHQYNCVECNSPLPIIYPVNVKVEIKPEVKEEDKKKK